MFPEWLIGSYMTGMSHGRNNSSSVAKSCPEGFTAKPSLLFQLILGSVLVSIWETGHGSNSILCSITSRHTDKASQVHGQFPLRSVGRDWPNGGVGNGALHPAPGAPSRQPQHLAWI